MGYAHSTKLGKYLAAEAKGKYAVISIEPSYDRERESPARKYELIKRDGKVAAGMTVQSMPGCCGVCVLHSFKGEAQGVTDFLNIGLRAAKRSGYGMVLCTLKTGSSILDQLPPADGDVRKSFLNGKTGNLITLAAVDLHQAPPEAKPTTGE
jgi:hypothetical protein